MAKTEDHHPANLTIPSLEATSGASAVTSTNTSPVRGRKRRRHSALSPTPPRSPSPSRGHERSSASRYREQRRSRLSQLGAFEATDSSADETLLPPDAQLKSPKRLRRRSDLGPDHTFRGRPRHRSLSNEDVIVESSSGELTSGSQKENYTTKIKSNGKGQKRRNSPPSRSRRSASVHRSDSPVLRRQRSLPNQYHRLRTTPMNRVGMAVDGAPATG